MMRSMSVAIAALRNHQVYMDVVSSNISNVNTTGFKASRISFQELLSQTLRGSSAPRGGIGGLNPVQIGLGMALGGIDTMFTQGSLQDTGKLTDLAIQGDGFFVLNNGQNGYAYTRDGNLDVGIDGALLNLATGMKVMGWQADPVTGVVDTSQALQEITIPFGQSMARGTSELLTSGNLDAQAVAGDITTANIGVYDSLGVLHNIDLTFTKGATANQWTWTASTSETGVSITPAGTTVSFGTDGSFSSTNPATTLTVDYGNGAAAPATITLDFSNTTQLDGTGNISAASQDGLAPGNLTTFTVGSTGEVSGLFSNGLNRTLGQIAMSTFTNPGGLVKEGQSLFVVSANSGTPQVGLPGTEGRGQIAAGYLEMSNVELAQQFTSMITAQRGFQANSRVITTSDEMLQELVNLKR
jgi:flagellar hook protein FlgE